MSSRVFYLWSKGDLLPNRTNATHRQQRRRWVTFTGHEGFEESLTSAATAQPVIGCLRRKSVSRVPREATRLASRLLCPITARQFDLQLGRLPSP